MGYKRHTSNSNFFYCDDRNQAIVWDDKQIDFMPQVKILNLDNEFNYSLRLDEEKTFGNKFTFSRGEKRESNLEISTLDNPNFLNECYSTSELFEWLIYIKTAPKDGKIYFTINNKDVEWYFQDALTEEEIKEGCVRPDEIVGSYALYCPKSNHVKGFKNYMCGKVGHIPAPYFLDELGNKIKAKMYIQGIYLIIDIPDKLLNWDYSKSWLTLDPTFGYTTAGGTGAAFNANNMRATKFSLTEDGTITSISWYHKVDSGSSTYYNGIYSDSSSYPANELTSNTNTITATNTSAQWNTNTLSSATALTAATLWIARVSINGNIDGDEYYDTGTSNQTYSKSGTYTNLPSTFASAGTGSARNQSIYATYTAGGGSTSSIKKYFGVAQASLKKVDGVAIASVKKLHGVANT